MKIWQKTAYGTCDISIGRKVKSELKQTALKLSLFRGRNGVVC